MRYYGYRPEETTIENDKHEEQKDSFEIPIWVWVGLAFLFLLVVAGMAH